MAAAHPQHLSPGTVKRIPMFAESKSLTSDQRLVHDGEERAIVDVIVLQHSTVMAHIDLIPAERVTALPHYYGAGMSGAKR
jgi:hypothetical protein